MDRSMALKTCRSITNSLFSGNRNYTLPKDNLGALQDAGVVHAFCENIDALALFGRC
jgi:hypothetical protein